LLGADHSHGLSSPENDPDAPRKLLERYLDSPARLEREGNAARALPERTYAAPRVAELIEGLFNEVIASGRQ
jgi:hypothetical protein